MMPHLDADYWYFDPVRALVIYQSAGYHFKEGQLIQGPAMRFSMEIMRDLAKESPELSAWIGKIFALADESRDVWEGFLRELVGHFAKQDSTVSIRDGELVISQKPGSLVPKVDREWEEPPF
jgi:hypothetical protein